MAERTIVGVDFSGAQEKGNQSNTWITEARLHGDTLEIEDCRPIQRAALIEFLENLQEGDSVVAMDFPFAVPRKFAEELLPTAGEMPDVWRTVAENIKEYHPFKKLRDRFVERHGEMIRRGDANYGGPFSPLKTEGSPVMLPMTFYGMKMLHQLWQSEKGFRVPPLSTANRHGPTLLETMPGVLLRSFGLPARNYKTKNKTNEGHPENNREIILSGLEQKFGQLLHINGKERKKCWDNADCLDSLVAAIGAAMWAMNQSQFLIPHESIPHSEELDFAMIEGWIYAPKK